jgi:hypothetical protein
MIPNNLLNQLNSLKANPIQFLMQNKFNVPQNLNSPNDVIQHLLNTGQINQTQLNQANQKLRELQNNPNFNGLIK